VGSVERRGGGGGSLLEEENACSHSLNVWEKRKKEE